MSHNSSNYSDRDLIFIGIVGTRSAAVNGEVVKNQLLLVKFRKAFNEVHIVDLFDFKKRFIRVAFELFALLIKYPKAKIVLSASSKLAYRFVKFFSLIRRSGVFYWVVGGSFAEMLKRGDFSCKPYGNLQSILVQGPGMVKDLHALGLHQARLIRNAKPIAYIPQKAARNDGYVKFVFISRVSAGKGCDYILEAARRLNQEGLGDRFSVSFYGKIESGYDSFLPGVTQLENVDYKGFLDLQEKESYDTLAAYDVMLFPTYWEGEGFAGIFIDAFIAGLPVICSDWNCNKDFINDELGRVIPVHDVDALSSAMRDCIDNKIDIGTISQNCQRMAPQYNIDVVLSKAALHELNLI